MNFKWLKVPKTNETKDVQSIRMWEVRWFSRYDAYHNCIKEEVECFLSEELANDFAVSLNNAFNLLRHTSKTKVTVTERK